MSESIPVLEMHDVWLRIPVQSRETRTLKKALIRSVTGGALRKTSGGAEIEALRGISCTIRHGERVALIGHNGAGKSTFLRLISGIYQATTGVFRASTPVFPMIQKSFITSQELSGLQAVKGHYLLMHGHLRGFPTYLQEIIEFSELGDFIHLPMKGYSEGMSARLLFALLTSGSHECLALDEGFGAGDARFFERAQKRLSEFIDTAGTLILASHSDGLLQQFCSRGLVFNQGQIAFDGPLESSLSYYHDHCI
ncbi:MAG: ATP-binding cassette domain-containing protein [Cyanobium sp. D14.bin.5]|nr:ATP-binding cassette domain-containing protein [Cyanobium sp. D14.bin.5]